MKISEFTKMLILQSSDIEFRFVHSRKHIPHKKQLFIYFKHHRTWLYNKIIIINNIRILKQVYFHSGNYNYHKLKSLHLSYCTITLFCFLIRLQIYLEFIYKV